MARVKIDIPEQILFRTRIGIRISDINYGGHVGNDSILSLLHEARLRWLKNSGMSEMDFLGVGLIMSDAEIAFRSEIFHGEEVEIAIGMATISRTGFELFYRMTHGEDGSVAVLAKTGMVYYDYQLKKVAMLPEERVRGWAGLKDA
jgi:acyl-CoA thioesterase FadM